MTTSPRSACWPLAATLLLLSVLPYVACGEAQFSAAEVDATKPWHFASRTEAQRRAQRLRSAVSELGGRLG